MAENGYVTIATTTSTPERAEPIVDTELYKVTPQYSVLSLFNAGIVGNSARDMGARKIIGFHQYDQLNFVTTTALANAGDTSISVYAAGNIAILSQLQDPHSNQTINVTAQPSSPTATSITVSALTYAIPANTVLIHMGWDANENWARTTPISRNAAKHYNYISRRQESTALTRDQEYRKQYGMQDVLRIKQSAMDNIDNSWNSTLAFSEERDGSPEGLNDGRYATLGLFQAGLKYNRYIVPGGAVTLSTMEYAAGVLKRYSPNGKVNIRAFTSERIRGMFTRVGYTGGLVRLTPDQAGNFGGAMQKLRTTIPGVAEIPMYTDQMLDATEYRDAIFLVNLANVSPVRFGPDELIQPNGALPNGAADIATGAKMWQWTQTRGWMHKIPIATCVAILGVKSVTY